MGAAAVYASLLTRSTQFEVASLGVFQHQLRRVKALMAKRPWLVIAVVFSLLAGPIILGPLLYVTLFGHYPEKWARVAPGMSSAEARQILGPPSADGRGLKGFDRWGILENGIYMELDLHLGSNESDQARVERVTRKKRFFRDFRD
jgi:hypothetical protein